MYVDTSDYETKDRGTYDRYKKIKSHDAKLYGNKGTVSRLYFVLSTRGLL